MKTGLLGISCKSKARLGRWDRLCPQRVCGISSEPVEISGKRSWCLGRGGRFCHSESKEEQGIANPLSKLFPKYGLGFNYQGLVQRQIAKADVEGKISVYYEHCLPWPPNIWCFSALRHAKVLASAGESDEDGEGGGVIRAPTPLLSLGVFGAQQIPRGLSHHQVVKLSSSGGLGAVNYVFDRLNSEEGR